MKQAWANYGGVIAVAGLAADQHPVGAAKLWMVLYSNLLLSLRIEKTASPITSGVNEDEAVIETDEIGVI